MGIYYRKIARRTGIKRSVTPNKVSLLRKIQLDIYYKIQPLFLLKNKPCAVSHKGCAGHANQVHHQKGRENWLLLVIRWWLPICQSCHDQINTKSAEAISAGFSVARNMERGADYKSMAREDIQEYINQIILTPAEKQLVC